MRVDEEARIAHDAATRTLASDPAIAEDAYIDQEFPPSASSIDGSCSKALAPKCTCGVTAALRTTQKEGINHGRPFWRCGRRRTTFAEPCAFFRWADAYPPSARAKRLQWLRHVPNNGWNICSQRWHFNAQSISQGALGDCWFISALRVVAERADLLHMLLGSAETALSLHEQRGALIASIFNDGRFKAIPVDASLPLHDDEGGKRRARGSFCSTNVIWPRKQAFARPGAKNQLWPCLVEKAYAKLYGSFNATVGGQVSEALLDLTGCPTEKIMLQGSCIDHEMAWKRIKQAVDESLPVGCAAAQTGEGIVSNHAYAVLDARELQNVLLGEQLRLPQQLQTLQHDGAQQNESLGTNNATVVGETCSRLRVLRLRNPWRVKEFNGLLSSRSTAWTTRLAQDLGRTLQNDGTFWMPFEKFVQRFAAADIVHAYTTWHAATCYLREQNEVLQPVHVWTERGGKAMLMSLRHSKRGKPSASFWYVDMSLVLFKKSITAEHEELQPVKILFSHAERERSCSCWLEAEAHYVIIPFSIGGVSINMSEKLSHWKRMNNCACTYGGSSETAFLRVLCESPFFAVTRNVRNRSEEQALSQALTRSPIIGTTTICDMPNCAKEVVLLSRKHMFVLCMLRFHGYVVVIAINGDDSNVARLSLSCGTKRMEASMVPGGEAEVGARKQRVLLLAPASASDHALELAFALEGDPLAIVQLPGENQYTELGEGSNSRAAREAKAWSYANNAGLQTQRTMMAGQPIDLVGETVLHEALARGVERSSGSFEPFHPDPIVLAL